MTYFKKRHLERPRFFPCVRGVRHLQNLPPDALLSSRDFCRISGLPESTLKTYHKLGEGPPITKIKGFAGYRAADVSAWLAKRSGGETT